LLLAAVLLLGTAGHLDGHFQLTVVLHSRSARTLTDVSYGLYSEDAAKYLVPYLNQHPQELRSVDNLDGDRFVVSVPWSERKWWGVCYGYGEPYRLIALRLKQNGGEPVCIVAEIPEGRGPRILDVDVP
jgi:hypothetical protein